MAYQPPLPNSSRLIDWGHSWVAPVPGPYNESNIGGVGGPFTYTSFLTNLNQWPNALRDALGVGGASQYTRTYRMPAQAAGVTNTYVVDLMPDDGTIDSIYYLPDGSLTGANTNTRKLEFQFGNWYLPGTMAAVQFNLGTNLTAGVAYRLFSINDYTGTVSAPGVPAIYSPYFSALRSVNGSATQQPQEFYWKSSAVGSGIADPGGTLIVRYGTRYRNYAAGGALLLGQNGVAVGNWQTCMQWSPITRPNAIEVNLTASSSLNSGTLTCSQLRYPIGTGSIINFPNGATFTLTSGANCLATTISGTGPTIAQTVSGTSPIQGHVQNGTAASGEYESLSPTGINVWTHGLNDSDGTTIDVPAWTETVRACIARNVCPSFSNPVQNGNWQSVVGTGGTWNQYTPPAGGVMPGITDQFNINSGPIGWTSSGAVGGSPSMSISIGPAFEGGTADLMLLVPAGANLGVAASVLVDGATPPQGTVTLNTESVSTSGLLTRNSTATSYSVSSTTLTSSGGTPDFTVSDIGKLVTASGGTISIPAGTIITAVASTTSATLSAAGSGSSGTTCTLAGYIPMVKRLTGLATGAHTITVNITAKTGANSVLMLLGLGLESQNPTTPVVWCNIARIPIQTTGQKTNAASLNTASAAVIAGTASPISGNTNEPAFGSNVQYVDIDSVFGLNSKYFFDGIHLNSLGHRLMARTLFTVMRNNFSPDQLMAR